MELSLCFDNNIPTMKSWLGTLRARASARKFEWLGLGILPVLGDLAAQRIEAHYEIKTLSSASKQNSSKAGGQEDQGGIDVLRTLSIGVLGFGVLAPCSMLWYPFLHRLMATRLVQR